MVRSYVLNSRCTHQGCTVDKWDLNYNIACPCHGSIYIISTAPSYSVPLAEPGQPPLAPYNFTYDGNDLLQIEIPGLDLKINSLSVERPSTPLRLTNACVCHFPAGKGATIR